MHKERCSLFFIELPISLLVVTKYNNTKEEIAKLENCLRI